MGKKKEPACEIKLGRIRATIWENQSEDQNVWFNVTISRLYKDGDNWKDSSSFRRDDLPIVSKANDMAYGWIWRQEMKLEQQRRSDSHERD